MKHLMGSIVFISLKKSVIADGYYAEELPEMQLMITETFVKLNELLGRD